MLFGFALALTSLYAFLEVLFPAALLCLRRSYRLQDDALPEVSVLVTCRNEARDLPRCLASLQALDFPRDKLQIVLVDDESTDQTLALLRAACEADPRFELHETRRQGSARLRGKARGLALAARHATGDWLFVTDADCAVPPGWLRHMLSRADAATGLLGGPFITEPDGLVGALEAAVSCFVMPYGLGVQALGGKAIASGPNMAIRRDVYEAAGGLEGSGMRVAEDMVLERIVTAAGLRTRVYADPETTVTTRPVPSLLHLVSQQRRWLIGGIEGDPVMYAMVLAMLGVLALAYATLLGATLSLGSASWPLWALVLAGNTCCMACCSRCTGRSLVWLAPVLAVHHTLVWPWLYVSTLLVRQVRWRGEAYVLHLPD